MVQWLEVPENFTIITQSGGSQNGSEGCSFIGSDGRKIKKTDAYRALAAYVNERTGSDWDAKISRSRYESFLMIYRRAIKAALKDDFCTISAADVEKGLSTPFEKLEFNCSFFRRINDLYQEYHGPLVPLPPSAAAATKVSESNQESVPTVFSSVKRDSGVSVPNSDSSIIANDNDCGLQGLDCSDDAMSLLLLKGDKRSSEKGGQPMQQDPSGQSRIVLPPISAITGGNKEERKFSLPSIASLTLAEGQVSGLPGLATPARPSNPIRRSKSAKEKSHYRNYGVEGGLAAAGAGGRRLTIHQQHLQPPNHLIYPSLTQEGPYSRCNNVGAPGNDQPVTLIFPVPSAGAVMRTSGEANPCLVSATSLPHHPTIVLSTGHSGRPFYFNPENLSASEFEIQSAPPKPPQVPLATSHDHDLKISEMRLQEELFMEKQLRAKVMQNLIDAGKSLEEIQTAVESYMNLWRFGNAYTIDS